MNMYTLAPMLCLGSALSAVAMLPAASATLMITNAVGSCQGALPTYEASLRKKPLGIINQGNVGTFVTCSPPTFADRVELLGQKYLFVNVNSSGVAVVNCTGVNGWGGSAFTPVYTTHSVIVEAGQSGRLEFSPGPPGSGFDPSVPMNVSCLLPPGTGVASVGTYFTL